MVFSSLALCTLLVATPFAAAADTMVYTAVLGPFGDNSQVTGKVAVFHSENDMNVAYSGSAALLEKTATDSTCAEVNGCGVHIHTGTSCVDRAAIGSHYYEDPVLSDPWTNERYTSSESASDAGFYDGAFQGLLEIGTTGVAGRVFAVHGEDGSIVACGILEQTVDNVLKTETTPLGDSLVTSEIIAISNSRKSGEICFFGTAYSLERELVSFKADPGGVDCTAGNGCGLHVHSGTSCADSSTQGGHFYNTATDPWATTGYRTTDADGFALFFDCVSTGETDMEEHPFIVHADDGSRVSCGLLMAASDEMMNMNSPTGAPASSVGKLAPLSSALAMLTAAVIAVSL